PCSLERDSKRIFAPGGLFRNRRRKTGGGRTVKRVFFFGDGVAEGAGLGKEKLGGKGAGLAEMTALGIPVPPGFTIETGVCAEYTKTGKVEGLKEEVGEALRRLEKAAGRRFGDPGNPLL